MGLSYVYKGEESCNATIINEIVHQICKMLQADIYTNSEIAYIFNIPSYIVDDIKRGHTWTSISKDYNFNIRQHKLFTNDQIHNICKYFQQNPKGDLTINEHTKNALIYNNYEITEKIIDAARGIYSRKSYKEISKDYDF